MNKAGCKRTTLSDVAQLAGVSAITVSRVLNQPEKVSDAMRMKVQGAVEKLGYIPNRSASALASSRSGIIGVVIPSLATSVYNELLRGIHEIADPGGYQVLLADTQYSPIEEERMVRTLLGQAPEAMILTGGDQTSHTRSLLKKADIPVVQLMDTVDDPIDMNVGFSHRQASIDLLEQLVAKGFEKIGFIGARMDARTQQQLDGYRTLMERLKAPWEEYIVTTPRPSSVETGVELFKSLMMQSSGECDAVVCANDDLAMGAVFESQRMHLRIPEDIAIAGFNDIDAAAYLNPPLTSVRVPRYEMGIRAMKMAVAALKGEVLESKVVRTRYELKFRASTELRESCVLV